MEQLLFDLNPNPMWIYDLDSLKILKANHAAVNRYGYSAKEFLSLTIKDMRPEEEAPALEKVLNTLKLGGLNESGVHLHQTKKGEVFYVQITSQPFPYKKYNARLVSAYDVTERIKAEENARNAYQELSHHIVNSPLAMVKWDSKFRVIEWSKSAERIIGYKESEILGKTPFAFGFANYRDANILIREMHELKSGGKNQNQLELKLLTKNNVIIHIRIHSSALRNARGELKSVLTLIEDVTRQRKAEKALKESEQRWENLVNNQPEMVQITRNGDILYINEAGAKIYGAKSAGDLTGTSIFRVLSKASKRVINERMVLLKNEKTVPVIEQEITGLDGKKRIIELNSISITYKGKQAIQTIGRDITERKQAERQIARSLKEKEILLSEIHHRVKNNLAVISGLIQLQVYNTNNEEARKILMDSQLRIHSMALIHEKLYKSDDLGNIDFSNYINDLIDSIKYTLQNNDRSIEVSTHTEPIFLDVNQAVPTALILNEMVTNAYEHAFTDRKEGRIDIIVKRARKNTIYLEVKDNGTGLTADFEELKKESLGIELIESLTRQLGGSLDIKSDNGAYFILKFKKK